MDKPIPIRGIRHFLPILLLPAVLMIVFKLIGPLSYGTNYAADLSWWWVLSPLFVGMAVAGVAAHLHFMGVVKLKW